MFDNIHIETDQLVVRNFRPDDTEAFQAILAQEQVMHYLPESVMSIEEVRKIIDWYLKCYHENTPEKILKLSLAVCLKDEEQGQIPPESGTAHKSETAHKTKVIGWSGVGPLDFDESQVELFYGIDPAYWGQDFATEASRAVLEHAFGTIGLKRIVAVVNPDNIGSVRVAEKLGMKFEKTLTGLGEKFADYEGSGLYSLTRQVVVPTEPCEGETRHCP